MSDVWRIFVVEGDENLNRNIVNSLRKDGYEVQGVLSGADAVRALWSEEYDLVICDLKTPSAEGIELLQWLRAYRPNTRMILVGGAAGEPSDLRMQALESGASSYLEKPLDLHLLKEEIRRLLQQTGFSANLDSFDLLDVIQIITMSRKSIALLVNTGLEERGILRFKNGELIWAEYGVLRGEEAFFALAAHKNGTVIHQPWNDQITSNVTQPLSRLIFQALQYRTKYANKQQFTGEQEAIVSSSSSFTDEIDDRPFAFLDDLEMAAQNNARQEWGMQQGQEANNENSKEWWERTGSIPEIKHPATPAITHKFTEAEMNNSGLARTLHGLEGDLSMASGPHSSVSLPSWLTDQPTSSNMTALPPQTSAPFPGIPITPLSPTSAPDWPLPDVFQPSGPPLNPDPEIRQASPANGYAPRRSSPTWELPANASFVPESAHILVPPVPPTRSNDPPTLNEGQLSQPMQAVNTRRQTRRSYNYASLVAALQTLGYAIPGFESAAIVSMEGQPIAQVSIDDQDLTQFCKQLSLLLKSTLQACPESEDDPFEDLVVQSRLKRTLLRIVGKERNVFLMLITSHDADLNTSREIVLNIDNAINVALRG